MRRLGAALMMLMAVAALAHASIFQYAVVAPQQGEQPDGSGLLWIPPSADRVRGVIIGGRTLIEPEFMRDPLVRQACAEEKLALLFLNKGLGGTDIQKTLDNAAKVSGYQEIAMAPVMPIGHSAGGPPARDLAYKMTERCFGLIQFRGGTPYIADPNGPRLPYVPCLVAIGQFDEFHGTMRRADGREPWQGSAGEIAAFNAADARHLGSLIVEPGAGHFAWSDRQAAYIYKFIRKAAQLRIPGDWPVDAKEPVACKPVDRASGWLAPVALDKSAVQTVTTMKRRPWYQLWHVGRSKSITTVVAPAPCNEYKGDKAKAQWFPNGELALANVAFHAGQFGKKDQFVKWKDSYWVDAGVRCFFNNMTWVGDGQTFEVHPTFAEAYPTPHSSGQGPKWLEAGKPVGNSGGQIFVKQVGGAVVPVGPTTMRIKYDALYPATEAVRVTFMAYSTGNGEYRHTELPGMMPRGFSGLKSGKAQTITFPAIANVKPDTSAIELKATSDSGLPVEYYVAYGPAVMDGNQLRLADLPARAQFPIEVKVVAYQFGRGIAPLFQTATPVEQTFMVEKP